MSLRNVLHLQLQSVKYNANLLCYQVATIRTKTYMIH